MAENLVENAIKYGGPQRNGSKTDREPGGDPGRDPADIPHIDIEVMSHRGNGVFSVRDYGAGIAGEHLPRLTERFYRIDAGQSRARGGTGLGLAIVKHIVARHRGRLQVESEVGHGALFTVTIPLKTQT